MIKTECVSYGYLLRVQEHGEDLSSLLEPPPPAPIAPNNLAGIAASGYQVDLTWTDNSDNESGFKIEMKAGSSEFTQVGIASANTGAHTVNGLDPLTEYTFRVFAYNAGGNSEYSAAASATTLEPDPAPSAPTELTAVVISGKQIDISWKDNADDESGYKIEIKSASGDFENAGTVAADVTTFKSENLAALKAYTYRVYAYNLGGNSDYSNTVTETTLDPAPCNSSTIVNNGEFKSGILGWELYNQEGSATSTLSIVKDASMSGDETAYVDITSGGDSPTHLQFFSPLANNLKAGVTYVLTFKAKSEVDRGANATVILGKAPWNQLLEQGN